MAELKIGEIGDRVLLQAMTCLKLYVGDVMICYGYMPCGEPQNITISGIHSCFILDEDQKLYKLLPEHDDDFYAVVEKPAESVFMSRKRYDRLISESNFLSALLAAGVDNWEGYSQAFRHGPDEDDNDDE
jgi:hypothetical protein